MSYFIPPDLPNRRYDIFGSGGGEALAAEMGVPLLGQVPLELPVREGGDLGQPILITDPQSASASSPCGRIAQQVAARVSVAALSPVG